MTQPTTNSEGLSVLAGTVRDKQPNNKSLIDNVVKFYVRVISQPINLAGSYADLLLSDNFIQPPFAIEGTEIVARPMVGSEAEKKERLTFMGKILRSSNGLQPHKFLEDPCRLIYAGESDIQYIEKIISLHTLFVSQAGVYGTAPKFGDVVSVVLGVSDFSGPELKVASFSEVSSTTDSELYNYERDVSCNALKNLLFDGSSALADYGALADVELKGGYITYERQRGRIVDRSMMPLGPGQYNIDTPDYSPVIDSLAPGSYNTTPAGAAGSFKIFLNNIQTATAYEIVETKAEGMPEDDCEDLPPTIGVFLEEGTAGDRALLREDNDFKCGEGCMATIKRQFKQANGRKMTAREVAQLREAMTLAEEQVATFHACKGSRVTEINTSFKPAPFASIDSPARIQKYVPYINSGRRSVKHQLNLYRSNSLKTAKPCESDHQYGFALDIKFYIPKILREEPSMGLDWVPADGFLCRTNCKSLSKDLQAKHLAAYREIEAIANLYGVKWYGDKSAGTDWRSDPVHWEVDDKGQIKNLMAACKKHYYNLYGKDPTDWDYDLVEDLRWPIETGKPPPGDE